MKRLWVVDGTLSLRAYFYSNAQSARSDAIQALTEKLDDTFAEWVLAPPVEVLRVDQIDSSDLKNDESVYLVDEDGSPDSVRGWISKLQEFAEQVKQEKREAEAASRQMKLFGDDGT